MNVVDSSGWLEYIANSATAGHMMQGRVIELDAPMALDAAKVSIQFSLPMADSIILATARAHRAILWTQDEHFKGIAGVRYIEKAKPAP